MTPSIAIEALLALMLVNEIPTQEERDEALIVLRAHIKRRRLRRQLRRPEERN